jgi:tRNA threonylcarbamoyladenosine biosynthesis protein TsaB
VLLLAIDTSTTAITVAVHDGSRVVAEVTTLDARGHAEHLAPGVTRALDDVGARVGDLTDIVCGLGPGPFTGLRVGIVTARTLALATGATLHGVCSLDALAHEAYAGGPGMGQLLVATDARRKEVYWARYAAGAGDGSRAGSGPGRLDGPHVARAADLPPEVAALPAVGRGPVLYPDAFGGPHGIPLDVSAAALADLTVRRLAAGEPTDEHEPYYLRRPDAVPSVPSATSVPSAASAPRVAR